MKLKLRAVLYAVIIAVLPVSAQTVCAARADLVKILTDKHKEQLVGRGIAGRSIVEVYVSETGSFTVFRSSPNGVSCMMAAGQDWQAEELKRGEGL